MKKKQYINEERMFRELMGKRPLKEEADQQLLINLLKYCKENIEDFDARAQVCNNAMGRNHIYGVEQNDPSLYDEMVETIGEYLEYADLDADDAYDLVDDVFFTELPDTDEDQQAGQILAKMCGALDENDKQFLYKYLNACTDPWNAVVYKLLSLMRG